MSVFRIYVEKKPEFAVEAQSVLSDIKTALRLNISGVRILNRYDADKLSEEDFNAAISTVFSEPAVDVVYDELPQVAETDRVFAVEYLPGQFDQRADSCEQCIQILRQGERCRVRNARIYILKGNIPLHIYKWLCPLPILNIRLNRQNFQEPFKSGIAISRPSKTAVVNASSP